MARSGLDIDVMHVCYQAYPQSLTLNARSDISPKLLMYLTVSSVFWWLTSFCRPRAPYWHYP